MKSTGCLLKSKGLLQRFYYTDDVDERDIGDVEFVDVYIVAVEATDLTANLHQEE